VSAAEGSSAPPPAAPFRRCPVSIGESRGREPHEMSRGRVFWQAARTPRWWRSWAHTFVSGTWVRMSSAQLWRLPSGSPPSLCGSPRAGSSGLDCLLSSTRRSEGGTCLLSSACPSAQAAWTTQAMDGKWTGRQFLCSSKLIERCDPRSTPPTPAFIPIPGSRIAPCSTPPPRQEPWPGWRLGQWRRVRRWWWQPRPAVAGEHREGGGWRNSPCAHPPSLCSPTSSPWLPAPRVTHSPLSQLPPRPQPLLCPGGRKRRTRKG